MSGGHFEYKQYELSHIADEIENAIANNDSNEMNYFGDPIGYGFSDETIAEFRKAVTALRVAQVYAQRIDWLLSGDDGEDTFRERLAAELAKLADAERGIDHD